MRSKTLLVANILATAYAVYLFYYFGNSMLDSSGIAVLSGALATALVAPHMFSFLAGAVFGWVGYCMRKNWGALTAAILYTVGTVTFLTYFMFGAPILIMGFIGYACQKKCNAEYELERLEQEETARIYAASGLPNGIVTDENVLPNGKIQHTGKLNFEEVKQEYNAVKRKKNGGVWIVLAVAVIVIFWGAYGKLAAEDTSKTSTTTASTNSTTNTATKPSNSTTANKTTTSSTANKTTTTTTPKTETKKEPETAKEPETIVFETELISGYYTVGIDIPAGRYDFTAIEGNGQVESSNKYDGGIDEWMGVDEDSEYYLKSYKNVILENDVVLEVSDGVKIKIHSDKADATPLKKRVQPNTETITLENGNYFAGEDFPAGVYDIIAVKGKGEVESDNKYDGGINAWMGADDDNEFYEKEYKNITLPEGTMVQVSLTIDLVPSK